MRSRFSEFAVAGGLTILSGCETARETVPDASIAPPAASAVASSVPPESSAPAAASSAAIVSADAPIVLALTRGEISSLTARDVPGMFDATLQTEAGPRRVVAWLGTRGAPTPRRRALAFYALARELDLDIVPVEVARPLPLRLVAELLPEIASAGDDAIVILNDATVPAVLATLGTAEAGGVWDPPSSPRLAFLDTLPERRDWMQQAESAGALPGEDPRTLRAFVGALILEYLAGHVLRKDVLLGRTPDGRTTLVLADNDAAFPPRVDPRALDRLLAPLRTVRRFPKGLLERLRAMDRARVDEVFRSSSFETMLLPTRDRLELFERIETVTTLIEARVEMGSRQAVLCL